jgi:hypothetical protein
VRVSSLVAMAFLFHSLLWAADAVAPSLELLEFLAEGAVVDGQWTDPVAVQEMSVSQAGNTGDEVKSHE